MGVARSNLFLHTGTRCSGSTLGPGIRRSCSGGELMKNQSLESQRRKIERQLSRINRRIEVEKKHLSRIEVRLAALIPERPKAA